MDIYTLTSKARPTLGDGQETRLYDVMEEFSDGPVSLDQIVKQCEYRRYASLLKTEPSVRNSVEWHLRNWVKRGIVKKI
ncbi:MAG: hypothetical protein JWQ42_2715 [Edaphobacter sp.]|nr:hypothetical protein [Edaphobacter sp.]